MFSVKEGGVGSLDTAVFDGAGHDIAGWCQAVVDHNRVGACIGFLVCVVIVSSGAGRDGCVCGWMRVS